MSATTVVPPAPPLFDEVRLAVAVFLARYSGPTRVSYSCDLRQFFAWCAQVDLGVVELRRGDLEVWAKQMKDGSRAVILFNRGSADHDISVNWEDFGYPNHLDAAVRDLWQKKDLGRFTGKFSASVVSHGVVMVTVKP